jgi:hypothetical protein
MVHWMDTLFKIRFILPHGYTDVAEVRRFNPNTKKLVACFKGGQKVMILKKHEGKQWEKV